VPRQFAKLLLAVLVLVFDVSDPIQKVSRKSFRTHLQMLESKTPTLGLPILWSSGIQRVKLRNTGNGKKVLVTKAKEPY